MLRVVVRGASTPTVLVGSGETLLLGRAPHGALAEHTTERQLRCTALPLPRCAPHVSRLVGELVVGDEMARLRWRAGTEARLSSLFDAPGGARRVTLTNGMAALLDEGENHLTLLRGKEIAPRVYADLALVVDVSVTSPEHDAAPASGHDRDAEPTGAPPGLASGEREWFVALALAEPWLVGEDDYPRPPSNREVYERVLAWHGYAWNLDRSQRVDDAIRAIAAVAFGPHDDPFHVPSGRRVQIVRFAVGRRAAEVRLVTVEDLVRVERAAAQRKSTA